VQTAPATSEVQQDLLLFGPIFTAILEERPCFPETACAIQRWLDETAQQRERQASVPRSVDAQALEWRADGWLNEEQALEWRADGWLNEGPSDVQAFEWPAPHGQPNESPAEVRPNEALEFTPRDPAQDRVTRSISEAEEAVQGQSSD